MALTPLVVLIFISFGFSTINNCLSMVIPPRNTTSLPTHLSRVRLPVHNSSIETFVNKRQLDLIGTQLQQRRIPYHQIQDNKDGITILIAPFYKPVNLTATIFNQSRLQTNLTKQIPMKTETKEKSLPMPIEAHEYNLLHDQESSEFRRCLESCEIYGEKKFKPNHDCIRKKCLKDITGI